MTTKKIKSKINTTNDVLVYGDIDHESMNIDYDFIDDNKISIEFINDSDNPDPAYMENGDSGFDIRASIEDDIIIYPGKTKLIETHVKVNLIKGYELQVRSRSGLAAKNNIFVLNSPGTIDYKWTDYIKIILTNLGEDPFIVSNGMRIAQCVISPVGSEHIVRLNKVDGFSSNKSRGGFGHTGIH